MLGKKIVVRFLDGKIIKGYTADFNPNNSLFHISPVEESPSGRKDEMLEIDISKIKAIFFVKDFAGNKEYQKVRTFNGYSGGSPSQRKIIIIFKDGENFYGTTHSYAQDRAGFFVFPIDQKDNNDRVFVSKNALEKVHLKKFGSDDFDIYLYEN